MRKRSTVVGLGMLLLVALCSSGARADEIPPPEETIVADEAPPATSGESTAEEVEEELLEGWQFELVPYMWIPGTSGRVSIGDRSAGFDTTVGDVLNLIGSLEAGGAMLHFEARNRRVAIFTDGIFSAVRATEPIGRRQVDTNIKSLTYLVEFGAAYRFFEYATTLPSKSPIAVDVLAGGRWNRYSNEVGRENLSRDAESLIRFIDPMVGGRFFVPFFERSEAGLFSLTFRGDIGGWGIGSDLAWNIVSTLAWSTPWKFLGSSFSVYAGYKAYSVEVEENVDGIDVDLSLQMNGPAIGLGFQF